MGTTTIKTISALVATVFLLMAMTVSVAAQGKGHGGGGGGGRGSGMGPPAGVGVDRGMGRSSDASNGRADTGRDTASDRSNGRSDAGLDRARTASANLNNANRELARNPGVTNTLHTNANALRAGYRAALLNNPELTFGQYVAATRARASVVLCKTWGSPQAWPRPRRRKLRKRSSRAKDRLASNYRTIEQWGVLDVTRHAPSFSRRLQGWLNAQRRVALIPLAIAGGSVMRPTSADLSSKLTFRPNWHRKPRTK